MSRIEDAFREQLAMEHGQPASTYDQILLKFAKAALGICDNDKGTQREPDASSTQAEGERK